MTYDRDLSRRDLLKMLSLAGGAGLLAACAKAGGGDASGDSSTAVASNKDEKLETTSIRLIMDPKFTVLCYAPQYLADQYLKEEGFTDVQYVSKIDGSEAQALIHGDADISSALAVDWIMPISRGVPVVILGGLHPGCVEIFASSVVACSAVKDFQGVPCASRASRSNAPSACMNCCCVSKDSTASRRSRNSGTWVARAPGTICSLKVARVSKEC